MRQFIEQTKIYEKNVPENNEKCVIILYSKSKCESKINISKSKSELVSSKNEEKLINDKNLACEKCKSLELVMSVYSPCHCIKKNGLQDQCSRKCCRGSKLCSATPKPNCCPSKFARKYMKITYGARKKVDLNDKLSYAFYKY